MLRYLSHHIGQSEKKGKAETCPPFQCNSRGGAWETQIKREYKS